MSTYDYDAAWQKVDDLQEKGLPKDAIKLTQAIKEQALADQLPPEIVASTYTIIALETSIDQSRTLELLKQAEREARSFDPISKALTQSYLAAAYYSYYQRNRWNITQSTSMSGDLPDDSKSWTQEHFYRKIHQLNQQALSAKEALDTSIEGYDRILTKYDQNGLALRPTLYLLAGSRAVTFYRSAQEMIVEHGNDYQWIDPILMADTPSFLTAAGPSDSLDLNAVVARTWQSLESYAQSGGHEDAADFLWLQRAKTVHQAGAVPNVEEHYLQALSQIAKANNKIVASSAAYELAAFYQSTDPAKSIEWAQKLIAQHDNQLPAVSQAKNLIKSIERPSLSGEVIQAAYPGKEIPIEITHRNMDQCTYTIYASSYDQRSKRGQLDTDAYLQLIKNGEIIDQGEVQLDNSRPYQSCTTSHNLPGLPAGQYEIVWSVESDEPQTKEGLFFAPLDVTTLACQHINSPYGSFALVVDRWTGKALPLVTVELWQRQYNREKRKQEQILSLSTKTDQDGKASTLGLNQSFSITLKKGSEIYKVPQSASSRSTKPPTPQDFLTIMTDRSIYRPGQMIYYKVLAVDAGVYDKRVLPRKKVTIEVKDRNWKVISETTLVTNDYGSAAGQIALPSGGLPGRYTIAATIVDGPGTSHAIRVEEYKRPKFEVKLDKPTSQKVLGDRITVQGNAVALAGNSIAGAQVRYKVTRSSYLPWWRSGYSRYFPQQSHVMLDRGTTETDEQGGFTLDFEAKYPPNQKMAYYNYELEVEVVDQNGETRTASTTYSLSKDGVRLETTLPRTMESKALTEVAVSAKNFAGVDQALKGELLIYALKEPDHYDYKAPTPNNRDRKATDPMTNWENDRLAAQVEFDTGVKKTIAVPTLQAGAYRVQLIAAKADTFTTHIILVDYDQGQPSVAQLLYHDTDEATYQPGDVATVRIAASDDVQVFYLVEHRDRLEDKWVALPSRSTSFKVPITEKDYGAVFYKVLVVSHNRSFIESGTIAVPFDHKELDLKLSTWRDKVLPGAEETWTLTLAGPDGDQVAAEVLAAMYDASLDQFTSHSWRKSYYAANRSHLRLTAMGFDWTMWQAAKRNWNALKWLDVPTMHLPFLNWAGGAGHLHRAIQGGRIRELSTDGMPLMGQESDIVSRLSDTFAEDLSIEPAANKRRNLQSRALMTAGLEAEDQQAASPRTAEPPAPNQDVNPSDSDSPAPVIRSDFRETAFFYPELLTNKEGQVQFTFTMPEALTRWRTMFLAHTKDMKVGYIEQEVQTQKDLMIVANNPRFLRAGDDITLTGKVSNLSDRSISGKASLQLTDAISGLPLAFASTQNEQTFDIAAGSNHTVRWSVKIPRDFQRPVFYEVVAEGTDQSDGERHLLPTVSNRKLVTETLPMFVPKKSSKSFSFDRLLDAKSPTLSHEAYTVEFVSNPLWYVLQALPTLEPKPFETTDYVAQRIYAMAVGSELLASSPRIKEVFDQWRFADSGALLSALEKNEELKTTLLDETPWVRDAADESTQKRLIAAYFDANKMANGLTATIDKLAARQRPDGGFTWCSGGRSSWYTTLRVLLTAGQLKALGLLANDATLNQMIDQAHRYNDEQLQKYFTQLQARSDFKPEQNHLTTAAIRYLQIQQLLDRKDYGPASDAYQFFYNQAKTKWLSQDFTDQAIIGQVVRHGGDQEVAEQIANSMSQYSIQEEELGMYWDQTGYGWSRLPVSRQTEAIKFYNSLERSKEVDLLTLHLLQLKKTNRWPTAAATTAAVHTLLTTFGDSTDNGSLAWVDQVEPVNVQVGKASLPRDQGEAGTLYTKKRYTAVKPSLAQIAVENNNPVVAWGAAYWQYWEDLDRITSFDDTPLKIVKTLHKKVTTDRGPQLQPVEAGTVLSLGDRLVTRLVIETDRDMSFVHLEDMRPAGVEPIDVISQFRYKNGLGYYQATRDLSTDFYIERLPKGTFVLEYDVYVSHGGDFSTGIATLQSYYAPEYSSHSEGSRITAQ